MATNQIPFGYNATMNSMLDPNSPTYALALWGGDNSQPQYNQGNFNYSPYQVPVPTQAPQQGAGIQPQQTAASVLGQQYGPNINEQYALPTVPQNSLYNPFTGDILTKGANGQYIQPNQTTKASVPGFFTGSDGGWDLSNLGTLANVGGQLGSIILGWNNLQNQKSAFNKQFNFQRDVYNKNLQNQTKAYNTGLADRARTRAAQEGPNSGFDPNEYVNQNKLTA